MLLPVKLTHPRVGKNKKSLGFHTGVNGAMLGAMLGRGGSGLVGISLGASEKPVERIWKMCGFNHSKIEIVDGLKPWNPFQPVVLTIKNDDFMVLTCFI